MTHDECRNSLSAWLDGALTHEESKAVSEHIVACRECRTASDELRVLSASLRALPRHELPCDLKAIVLEGAGAPASRAWLFRPWALASAAALASVLVVIGVVGLRRPDTQQIARLDAKPEQGFATTADLEQAPEKTASKEAFNEPVSPAPAGQNPARQYTDRFSPTPPAAPEDKPSDLDDRLSALGYVAGDEKKQDRNETREAAEVAQPSSSVDSIELKKAGAAPEEAQQPSALAASALTYVARLTTDESGTYKLVRVEPPAVAGLKDGEADAAGGAARSREKSARTGAESGSAGPAAAGAPAMAREGERATDARDSTAVQGKPEAGDPNQMIFLVQLDAEGKITSAQLVGARTQPTEVVEAARGLLIGTDYSGDAMGRFSHATVQVLVETTPPKR